MVLGATTAAAAERPTSWASPLDWAGVPNAHLVSPNLYRSAQPSAEGMQRLKKQGVPKELGIEVQARGEANPEKKPS